MRVNALGDLWFPEMGHCPYRIPEDIEDIRVFVSSVRGPMMMIGKAADGRWWLFYGSCHVNVRQFIELRPARDADLEALEKLGITL